MEVRRGVGMSGVWNMLRRVQEYEWGMEVRCGVGMSGV